MPFLNVFEKAASTLSELFESAHVSAFFDNMSKVGSLLNGDLTDSLVGPFDSRMRTRDFLKQDDWSEKVAKVFSCEVDHMYASVNDVQEKDREIQQLKEIMLVNLDLIQRQSDVIVAKDKKIAALLEENNMVRILYSDN